VLHIIVHVGFGFNAVGYGAAAARQGPGFGGDFFLVERLEHHRARAAFFQGHDVLDIAGVATASRDQGVFEVESKIGCSAIAHRVLRRQ
jgi:hypothetical protein